MALAKRTLIIIASTHIGIIKERLTKQPLYYYMKIILRFALAVAMGFLCHPVSAQNTNPSSSNPLDTYLNNFVQPAPNAASLGKYADYPVSYFTGVPQIGILLYTLNDGGINLPISLSYHASGIRVSETASWVGLGWALNAGGVIIRTVRGAPDEGTKKGGQVSAGPAGYYKDFGLSTLPKLPYPLSNGQTSDPSSFFYNYTAPEVMAGMKDCEPDLYTFNFNGHVGKFVFDENRTARLLEDDDLQIKVVGFDNNNGFHSFEIITPDGVQYYFGENNMYEITVPYSTAISLDQDSRAPSSWYLTRIVNPNTKDTATFNYTKEIYAYNDLGPESQLYCGNQGSYYYNSSNPSVPIYYQYPIETSCDNSSINGGAENWGVKTLISTNILGLRLTSITTNNYTVDFIAQNPRADLMSGPLSGTPALNSFSLDSIKVYSNLNNQCIKQFALGHSYFVSKATGTAPGVINALSSTHDSTDAKRLKLTSVTEYSGDGTISKPPYVLTYQESFPNYPGYQLPRRLSYDQDHWGYSNNAAGGLNYYFTPGISSSQCTTAQGAGANRNPSWPDMLAFTLTGIQDPLGAMTTFTYGPNSAFYNPANIVTTNDTLVGGLRILQIKVQDNVTGSVQTRSFSYSNGYLVHGNPSYYLPVNNEYYYVTALGSGSGGYDGYYSQPGAIFLKQSQSIVPLQDEEGNLIAYPNVKESFGSSGSGSGGYKLYTFSAAPQINQQNTVSRLDFSNYTAYGSMQGTYNGSAITISGSFGNGLFNEIPASSLTYASFQSAEQMYPATPQQVDVSTGKLIKEETYDSSNNLLESDTSIYDTTYHENYLIRGLKAYTPYVNSVYNPLSYYKLHTGISHLRATIEKMYRNGQPVIKTTTYTYDSPYHTQSTTQTTTNSNGDVLFDQKYYSFDYAASATLDGVFTKMLNRNILVPVSTQSWINNTLVNGKITQFQDFAASSADTLIKPVTIYALETASPLSPAQASETPSFTAPQTTLLPNPSFVPKASFAYNGANGKLTDQQIVAAPPQSVIWDNGLSLPLAVVKNSASSDIAYNSFESAEAGNWTFPIAGVTHDPTAPTGSNVYLLSTSNTITKTGLQTGVKYMISYWSKYGASVTVSGGTLSNTTTGPTIQSWTLNQVVVTTTGTSIIVSGTGFIDELRLFPVNAQMVTYCYDLSLRLVTETGANGTISHYQYDAMNRLVNILDQYGNIIKSFCYNYAGQAFGCNINVANSSPVSQATPYVQMNLSSTSNSTDVNGNGQVSKIYTVETFSDAACTIPYTLPIGLTVNYQVNTSTTYTSQGQTGAPIATSTSMILTMPAGTSQRSTNSIMVNGCTGTSQKGNCSTSTVALVAGTGYLLGNGSN